MRPHLEPKFSLNRSKDCSILTILKGSELTIDTRLRNQEDCHSGR